MAWVRLGDPLAMDSHVYFLSQLEQYWEVTARVGNSNYYIIHSASHTVVKTKSFS